MWRLALKNTLAHRSRLALTWLAVVLGVAFVTGSLVLTDTSSQVLDEQFRAGAADVDLTVRAGAAFDSAMGVEVQREPLPSALAGQIAAVPGVAAVRSVAAGTAQMSVASARPITDGQMPSAPALLGSWAQAPFTNYALRFGHAPRGADEAVMDVATAQREHVALGDTIRISATASRTLRVVGLTGFGDADGMANTPVVLTGLATAQTLLGLGTQITSVEVVAADDAKVSALRTRVAEQLGSSYTVASAQDAAAASARAAQQSIQFLRVVLLALAAAGLVVGAFLITNTFRIVLSQQSKEFALLRAAGATGRQVLGGIVVEALIVGVSGAAGGAVFGIGAAYGLRGLAHSAGLALPDGPLSVTASTLGIAMASGILVTLLAAVGPARHAVRIAPVEAMRASDPALNDTRRGRIITGWMLFGGGLVALLGVGFTRSIGMATAGAVLLMAGLILLGPVVASFLARTVGRPLQLLGAPGRLARESAARNARRTAATVMALAIGLSLISFVSVVGSSVKTYTSGGMEAVTADLLVQSSSDEMLGGLSPEVGQRVAALPEVSATSVTRFGHWLDEGTASALTAVDPLTLTAVAQVRMVAGTLSGIADGGIVIAESTAAERGLGVGDTLAMTFPRDGEQTLRVVGIMADKTAQALSTDYMISLRTYASHFNENVDATVYAAVSDGVSASTARTAVAAAIRDFPNAQVRDQAEAAAGRAAAIDHVLGLVTLLLGLAVLIALLGITNTLALSIVERTREMGLLRAVGMTRRQVGWMIRAEAVLVATIATVTGLLVGVGVGIAIVAALSPEPQVSISVPAGQLAVTAAGAVVAGLAAGLLPARRASRIDLLTAIAVD